MNKNVTALLATSALFSAQAAQAADAVYLGDCERARMVQQQSTIDKLLPHNGYEGITRMYINSDWAVACRTDQLQNYSLKLRSRNSSLITYDVSRADINYDRKAGCAAPVLNSTGVSGSVVFTTKLEQKGELCELYIWSDWKMTLAGNATWSGNFANRVVSMDGGSFVISQPASTGGKYTTPISFTGVNP
jgi:opacity protein-like surface antigen